MPKPEVPKSPPPIRGRGIDSRRLSRREKTRKNDRTLSQRFIRAPLFDMSQFVWIEAEEKVWALCTILNQDNTVLKVQNVDSAKVYRIDLGFDEVKLCNKKLYDDMSKMEHIHEPAILFNITRRLLQRQHQPYTFIGKGVLVSVNPLSWQHPNTTVQDFLSSYGAEIRPHPFALAERAFQNLQLPEKMKNQCIVITGETGSGKTEISKLVLDYLTKRFEQNSCSDMIKALPSVIASTKCSIMNSSQILEAFGNAKTSQNSNSSRFGKFSKVMVGTPPICSHNDALNDLVGARHEIYLLEKSRVLGQAQGEQNFHVFYQYLSGVANNFVFGKKSCHLDEFSCAEDFRLLNSCDSLDVMFDKFRSTNEALRNILDEDNVSDVWNIVGGILQLGNVSFADNETPEGNASFVSGLSALQSASSLLGIDWKEMRHLMTQKVIETRGERFIVPLTLDGAVSTRDSVCKAVYEFLFQYIVDSLNCKSHLQKEKAHQEFIAVLDLFGFENLHSNGFNQFMVNFANEALHGFFIERILQDELKLYNEEGIECSLSLSDCPNNEGCLDLISSGINSSSNYPSILGLLDSVCQQTKANDVLFCDMIHRIIGNSDENSEYDRLVHFFPYTHPKDRAHLFNIKHYTGVVTYAVCNDSIEMGGGWIESNMDAIPFALENLMKTSDNFILKNYVNAVSYQNTSVVSNTNNLSRQKLRLKSVSTLFVNSIRDLLSALKESECSFIRCIKPNETMRPDLIDNSFMIKQIRSLALVQTSQVMQMGFQCSLEYDKISEFLYSKLLSDEASHASILDSPFRILVSSWLIASGIEEDLFILGKSKVFFRQNFEINKSSSAYRLTKNQQAEMASAKLISYINSLRPREEVIADLHKLAQARKNKEESLAKFKSRIEHFGEKVDEVSKHLKSYQSSNVPSLLSFESLFKLISEANAKVELAHVKMDNTLEAVRSVKSAIETSEAPVKEAELIEKRIKKRVEENKAAYCRITESLQTLLQFEEETRDVFLKLQESFNNMVLDYWESVAVARKLLSYAKSLLEKVDHDPTHQEKIAASIESNLSEVDNLLASKLPNERSQCSEDYRGQFSSQDDAQDRMMGVASGVISSCEVVFEDCSQICEMCKDAEVEVEESKNTLLHYELLTKRTLLRMHEKESAFLFSDILKSKDETSDLVDKSEYNSTKDSCAKDGDRSVNDSVDKMEISTGKLPQMDDSDESLKSFDSDADDDISVIDIDFWSIPVGWEEYFDPDTQSSYYLNTITQATQWDRPTLPAEGMAGDVAWTSDSISSDLPHENEEASFQNAVCNYEEDGDTKTFQSFSKQSDEFDLKIVCASPSQSKIDEASRSSSKVSDGFDSTSLRDPLSSTSSKMNNVDSSSPDDTPSMLTPSSLSKSVSDNFSSFNDSPEKIKTPSRELSGLQYGHVTTSQSNTLGSRPKEGYLMKQSSAFFMSRWSRKYFVLKGLNFECYEKSDHYIYGLRKPKSMLLSLSTCTSFTDDDNCFIVKTSDENGQNVTWTLAAPSLAEKNDWVAHINAHVYAHYCSRVASIDGETPLDRRLMNISTSNYKRQGHKEQEKSITFWQLVSHGPGDEQKSKVVPVGIRSFPDTHAPRTGEAIFPGEHIEIVSTKEEKGVTYLRLADNRGWVFTSNPSTCTQLFIPAVGYTFRVKYSLKFEVINSEPNGLPIQYNPGDSSPFTGATLKVGDIVEISASFELDLDSRKCLYLKLSDGRGWVNTRGVDGGIAMKLAK